MLVTLARTYSASKLGTVQVAGLVVCLLLIDVLGRKACLALFLLGTCAFLGPFLRAGGPSVTPQLDVSGVAVAPEVETVDVAMLFLLRMTTYATFIVIFIYTPEVYPTKVRSYAFGTFNAICRLGGLVGPFVGVQLFQQVCRFCASACTMLAAQRNPRAHVLHMIGRHAREHHRLFGTRMLAPAAEALLYTVPVYSF